MGIITLADDSLGFTEAFVLATLKYEEHTMHLCLPVHLMTEEWRKKTITFTELLLVPDSMIVWRKELPNE